MQQVAADGSPAGAGWRYSFEPYGGLIFADRGPLPAGQHLRNGVGHQGLLFERFRLGPGELFTNTFTLEPNAAGLYYNRGRWFSPALGRFVSRDMNAAALPVLTALAFNGQAAAAVWDGFDLRGQYGDGLSLYAYAGSNPINRSDPMGLQWGMEDEIDELISDRVGHAMYSLGALNEGARWAALGLNTALDIAGTLLGVDVFESVELLASGRGGFWEAIDVLAAVNPVGKLGKIGGTLGDAAKWARRGGKAADASSDLYRIIAKNRRGIDPRKLAEAAEQYPKLAGKIEQHHLIPLYLGGARSGPSIPLDAAYHQLITGASENPPIQRAF